MQVMRMQLFSFEKRNRLGGSTDLLFGYGSQLYWDAEGTNWSYQREE